MTGSLGSAISADKGSYTYYLQDLGTAWQGSTTATTTHALHRPAPRIRGSRPSRTTSRSSSACPRKILDHSDCYAIGGLVRTSPPPPRASRATTGSELPKSRSRTFAFDPSSSTPREVDLAERPDVVDMSLSTNDEIFRKAIGGRFGGGTRLRQARGDNAFQPARKPEATRAPCRATWTANKPVRAAPSLRHQHPLQLHIQPAPKQGDRADGAGRLRRPGTRATRARWRRPRPRRRPRFPRTVTGPGSRGTTRARRQSARRSRTIRGPNCAIRSRKSAAFRRSS